MKNIPTDLLRSLIAVVDLRSFTRAAEFQGLTQPAISAHIRRLQSLIGAELLDKSVHGVNLTATGHTVINAARRMLSINDHILTISKRNPAAKTVRIGIPGDCMGADLGRMLAGVRAQWPSMHFAIEGGGHRLLLQGLKDNAYDIVLALVIDEPMVEARHYWTEPLAWVRAEKTDLDLDAAIPLVAYEDGCVCHRIAVSTLNRSGRSSELVFRATSSEGLRSAVAEGVGVMVMPRRRNLSELTLWDDGPLPALPDVYCGVFIGENCDDDATVQFADHIAETMRPERVASNAG